VLADQPLMKGQIGSTLWVPRSRTSSSAKRAIAEPTPFPSKAGSTSVWVKTISSDVSWYSAKPASRPSRWAS